MYFDDSEGYWFSTEDGTHIFARYGQSKAEAINEFVEYHNDYFYCGNKIIKYETIQDMMDSKIFHYYFSRLKLGKKNFSQGEKVYFVSILKSIYDKISPDDLNYYLIPDDANFLDDSLIKTNNASAHIALNYKWPPNQGFLEAPTPILLKKGFVFDRYGNPYGMFGSPIISGTSYSIKDRALPYYIPADKKKVLYHKYEVIEDFSKIRSSIESFYDSNLSPEENNAARILYLKEFYKFSKSFEKYKQQPGFANIGKVAPAFDGGGGIQIELPMKINSLLKLKIIKEVD